MLKYFTCFSLICISAWPTIAGDATATERLQRLSEGDRRAVMAAAVRSSAQACRAAGRVIYRGAARGDDAGLWAVRCSEGDYLVRIDNRGDMRARVLACRIAAAVGVSCGLMKR